MAQHSPEGHRSQVRRGFRGLLRRYLRDRRGNIAALTALLIIPLVGVMGIATEASSWFLIQRAMQNAADSAVVAAAQNDSAVTGGTTTYSNEAKSVAAGYNFVTGTNNTTVTPSKGVTCPAPLAANGNACYQVSISRNVPIYLSNIVGYSGTGGTGLQTVSTLAIAGVQQTPVTDCIFIKGTGGNGYRINGAGGGSIDLNGCNIQSNGDATCNGTNSTGNVNHFFVSGTNQKCNPASPSSPLADPYTTTYPRTNIHPSTCNSSQPTNYYQENNNYGTSGGKGKGNGNVISLSPNNPPAANQLSGTVALTPNTTYCGDVVLSADTTLTGSGTMVIENGRLDLKGHKLTGAGVTLIFTAAATGTNFNPAHYPPTDGTLDISAPTSGTWSGVAIYQDPNVASNVDWSSSGNALNWDVTGLIYMPNSNISFSGTINKATGGANCFTMVANSLLVSGTVKINETQSGCTLAGLTTLPTSFLPRVLLVQ